MALERFWNAVPPVLLTVNGSTEGVVIVTDTAGFYVKMLAILQAPLLPPLTVQIKRVVNSTTLWVGLPGPSMLHNLDVSRYTILSNSFIYANEQSKTTLPMEARFLATYEQEPIDAWRTRNVDSYGNGYSPANPLPVTPFSQFFGSLTLGALGMPTLFSQCLSGVTYDQTISTTNGNTETLNFLDSGVSVDSIVITYSPGGWTFKCNGPIMPSFLLLETGDMFELEDGSGFILLE